MIVVETGMLVMPICCYECRYYVILRKDRKLEDACFAENNKHKIISGIDTERDRPEWCPLREVEV